MRQHLVAQRARHGDLLAGGQVARAGDHALRVDGVACHHIELGLAQASPHAGGEARLEVARATSADH